MFRTDRLTVKSREALADADQFARRRGHQPRDQRDPDPGQALHHAGADEHRLVMPVALEEVARRQLDQGTDKGQGGHHAVAELGQAQELRVARQRGAAGDVQPHRAEHPGEHHVAERRAQGVDTYAATGGGIVRLCWAVGRHSGLAGG